MKNESLQSRVLGCLGGLYLVIPLGVNEFVLKRFFSQDGELQTSSRLILLIADLMLVGLGLATRWGRNRPALAKVNLAVLSLGFTALVAESYLRLTEDDSYRNELEMRKIRTIDPYLHHTLRPNITGRHSGRRYVIYRTNSLGFRDLDHRPISRITGADHRILLLGDSFTECFGVEYEMGFPHRLQQLFRKDGKNVEILDGGVVGYSPKLEYRKLKKFLDDGYRADVVILMLDISDVGNEMNDYGQWTGYTEPEMAEIQQGHDQRLAELYRLNQSGYQHGRLHSRLLDVVVSGWRAIRQHAHDRSPANDDPFGTVYSNTLVNWTETDAFSGDWVQQGLQRCQESIQQVADLCRSESMRFFLVIYPHPPQLAGPSRPSRYERVYEDFARAQGVDLIDLFPGFFALSDWRKDFFAEDIHWNNRGHAVVARLLYDRLAGLFDAHGATGSDAHAASRP